MQMNLLSAAFIFIQRKTKEFCVKTFKTNEPFNKKQIV